MRVGPGAFQCVCTICGEEFIARYSTAATCGPTCNALRWQRAHPERTAVTQREGGLRYYHRNRDRLRMANAAYKLRERERCSERQRLREAKRRAGPERVVSLVLLERDDGVCGICGEDVDPFAFEVDHIVPLARGGEHSYANTQPSHPTCNRRKHATVPGGVTA